MEPSQDELNILFQDDGVRDTFEAICAGLCARDHDYEAVLIPALQRNLFGVIRRVTGIDVSNGDYNNFFNWSLDWRLDNVAAYLVANCDVNPNNTHLAIACEDELVSTVRELLKVPWIDPSAHDSVCLRQAVECGDIEIVALLLKDRRADPCASNALLTAQNNGFDQIVELLEADGRARPGG